MKSRRTLCLFGVSLGLAQCALADVRVHASVLVDDNLVHRASESAQCPMHDTMGPVRCAGSSDTLRTTAAADLAQSCADELLRVGNKHGCLANLAHGASDEVRLHKLDLDALGLELRAECGRPLLQECFAAAVRSEVGRGQDTAERCHCEDQTALALNHAWSDDLSDTKSAHAVDCDDVAHLLLRSLVEWNGDAMAQADIVDQDGDIKLRNQALDVVIVLVQVGRKVHGNSLRLNIVLALDFRGEGIELALGARDEEDVVALLGELEGVLFSETVGGTGHKSPGALLAKLGKLKTVSEGSV